MELLCEVKQHPQYHLLPELLSAGTQDARKARLLLRNMVSGGLTERQMQDVLQQIRLEESWKNDFVSWFRKMKNSLYQKALSALRSLKFSSVLQGVERDLPKFREMADQVEAKLNRKAAKTDAEALIRSLQAELPRIPSDLVDKVKKKMGLEERFLPISDKGFSTLLHLQKWVMLIILYHILLYWLGFFGAIVNFALFVVPAAQVWVWSYFLIVLLALEDLWVQLKKSEHFVPVA